MNRDALCGAAIGLAFAATAAWATDASAPSIGRCLAGLEQIEACEQFMQAGHAPDTDIAAMLHARADLYAASGDFTRAAKVYDEAIRLHSDAVTLTARGRTHAMMGDTRHATEDYNAAITLDAAYAPAYFNRGVIAFMENRFADAAEDFAKPDTATAKLWRNLAERNAGKFDDAAFARDTVRFARGDWPAVIVKLYRGEAKPEDVRAEAEAAAGAMEKKARNCQAGFYIGEYNMMRHSVNTAVPILEHAVLECPHQLPEYDGALSELGRLP